MNPPSSADRALFSSDDRELLNCLIAAPTQKVAAEWLEVSSTHLRRRLKELRDKTSVETNAQLIVLASISGAVDPGKVLPMRHR